MLITEKTNSSVEAWEKILQVFQVTLKNESDSSYWRLHGYIPAVDNLNSYFELNTSIRHQIENQYYQLSCPVQTQNKILLAIVRGILDANKKSLNISKLDLTFANQILAQIGFARCESRKAMQLILEKIELQLSSSPAEKISKDQIIFDILLSLYGQEISNSFILDLFAQLGLDAKCIEYLAKKRYVQFHHQFNYTHHMEWSNLKEVIRHVLHDIKKYGPTKWADHLYTLKVEMCVPHTQKMLSY